jgi:hypothetical protein
MADQPKGNPPPPPLKLSQQGIRGYLETRAHIISFVKTLEEATAEKDKNVGAIAAIAATLTFLMKIDVRNALPHLRAPLAHAAQIIKRDMKKETLFAQRQLGDLWASAVVSLLNEEGDTLDAAARKIHDRDPKEAKRLIEFRNNMSKKKSKKAKQANDTYHLLKSDFKKRFPEDTGARALRACRAMMGKKG